MPKAKGTNSSAAWREPSVRPLNGTRRAELVAMYPEAQTKALARNSGYVG